MRAAESRGDFSFEPNFDPATAPSPQSHPFGSAGTTIPTIGAAAASITNGAGPATAEVAPPKRKNSLDDFELEIEGMNLDDNIDTSVG